MGVLRESWCFCNGGGKSERTMAVIYSAKSPAMATISSGGTGFLIHRNLLLTTHMNLPSVPAAEAAEIRLQNGVPACLFPHRFFITSSVLDLTMVGLDVMDGDLNMQAQQPHYLKTCAKPNLELGSAVFLLGYVGKELSIGEGKLVIATDNLIKLSTDGIAWSPGSAGFDAQGNLAFMVCDPMKLATSPNTKSSETSSSSTTSWKKDLPMQFGIPIPIICDWLNQHWEGNLDELNKPKLPLIRLMSAGHKSEHSSASFAMRQVFKSTEAENDGFPSSSNGTSKQKEQPSSSCSAVATNCENESCSAAAIVATHRQGIPTPEIYESPKLTAVPTRKNGSAQIQLLDINFPPRVSKATFSPLPPKNCVKEFPIQFPLSGEVIFDDRGQCDTGTDAEIASTGSVNRDQSEVQSSSSPVDVSEMHNGYSSEGGTTMHSAETAESRNYTSPRQVKFQQVGRSQSCVNYNRWGPPVQRNPVGRRAIPDHQRNLLQGRKVYSQGAAASQRCNDYFSPTVSSIMKKQNCSEKKNRPRQTAVHSSPRWMF